VAGLLSGKRSRMIVRRETHLTAPKTAAHRNNFSSAERKERRPTERLVLFFLQVFLPGKMTTDFLIL
jgi:hypothetical protein